MTVGAILFMSITWTAVLVLNLYCFWKLMRENSGPTSENH